jgi:hypothetical protein
MDPFDIPFNDLSLSDDKNKVFAHAEKLSLHGPSFAARSPTKAGYAAWVVFNGWTNGVFETWYVITLIHREEASGFNTISGQRHGHKWGGSPMVIRGDSRHERMLKLHGTMLLPMVPSVLLAHQYL